tara:strand:- start:630 stop:1442 length:813 start_codon:yes stop_codon:yes gene_type:complete
MKITKSQLLEIIREEILKEAGHTDVPSSRSDLLTIGEDAAEILQALQMVPEDQALPTWWTNKLAVAASHMNACRDYLLTSGTKTEGVERTLSEGLQHHIDNKIPVSQNVFRPGSESFFALFKEVRELHKQGKYELQESEKYYILETTDLGEWGMFEGRKVPLDYPFLYEDEEIEEAKYKGREVKLGAPGAKRSGDGRAYVFVRDKKSGNVRKVSFGSSMPDAMGDSEAARKRRKNFGDRHGCAKKKDKTKAGYWACRATKMFGRDIPGWW